MARVTLNWESPDVQAALAIAREGLLARQRMNSIRSTERAAGRVALRAAQDRLRTAVRKVVGWKGGATYGKDFARLSDAMSQIVARAERELPTERAVSRREDAAVPA